MLEQIVVALSLGNEQHDLHALGLQLFGQQLQKAGVKQVVKVRQHHPHDACAPCNQGASMQVGEVPQTLGSLQDLEPGRFGHTGPWREAATDSRLGHTREFSYIV